MTSRRERLSTKDEEVGKVDVSGVESTCLTRVKSRVEVDRLRKTLKIKCRDSPV